MTIAERSTTGIGSLPHHNVDAALEFSFRMGIPFLPQIPIRNPWEFMIAQALEDLPGLQLEEGGEVALNLDVWRSRAPELERKLSSSYAESRQNKAAFEFFEPSPSVSSSWQPFVWELQERRQSWAKVQIAGPMTAQWALKMLLQNHAPGGGAPGDASEETQMLANQIFKLVLARALAMTRRLQSKGIQPIVYLDEPGLYGLTLSNPLHVLALQELKLMIQTIRKEGVTVGLHCCSNTDWNAILGLNLNLLSIDTGLSLDSILEKTAATGALEEFIRAGGRLSLGVIPTGRSALLHGAQVKELFTRTLDSFARHWGGKPELVRKVLSEAIYTPACGLALHSVADAELVMELLTEFADISHA